MSDFDGQASRRFDLRSDRAIDRKSFKFRLLMGCVKKKAMSIYQLILNCVAS